MLVSGPVTEVALGLDSGSVQVGRQGSQGVLRWAFRVPPMGT